MINLFRNKWIFAALAILLLQLWVVPMVSAKTYNFKLSIENVPSHPKAKGVQFFLDTLVKKSNGQFKPQLFHSAQLYKDSHAAKAVNMGTLQMAVVGNYVLDGYEINATLTHLPMFFGQTQDRTMELIDGEIGKRVSAMLTKKMKVEVIGRFMVMGFDNVFTLKKKIEKMADFKGMRIRHAGGAIYTVILDMLKAKGVVISWPDVPMALSRGVVDGLATTAKSVESAKLQDAGVKYGLECRNHVSYYFPLVNRRFWKTIPPKLQKIFMEAWEESVPVERKMAADDQIAAKKFLESKGVVFVSPSEATLTKWRNHIMPCQAGLVKDLKYDPALVKLAKKVLGM